MRYLALGDSYTIGDSAGPAERFPAQLRVRLQEEGMPVETELIARGGWTTDELREAILQQNPHGPYDLVTLLIGVNNQFRGRTVSEYRPEFVDLLTRAIAFAGGDPQHVVVISIPDYGVTPVGKGRPRVREEIDEFNAVNRAETGQRGARYVDVTSISRQAANEPGLIASDGLHPSGKMYARWVEVLLPVAKEILASKHEPGQAIQAKT
jgi:lysophospholipase L1-like esterase